MSTEAAPFSPETHIRADGAEIATGKIKEVNRGFWFVEFVGAGSGYYTFSGDDLEGDDYMQIVTREEYKRIKEAEPKFSPETHIAMNGKKIDVVRHYPGNQYPYSIIFEDGVADMFDEDGRSCATHCLYDLEPLNN